MVSYKVIFRRVSTGEELRIDLYSHYTCICGKDSGEGKTEFLESMGDGLRDGEIEYQADFNLVIADENTFETLLNIEERTIIMIDEMNVLRLKDVSKVNNSRHLIIAISRAFPLRIDYPLCGIYELHRTEKEWFSITASQPLPLYRRGEIDRVMTEAAGGKSENALLSVYFERVEDAGGRDRIQRKLLNTEGKILVFADLGCIGKAYKLLLKRCQQNPNIRFYDYQAFEELLCKAPVIQALNSSVNYDPFDYSTLERYYGQLLQGMTEGTPFAYFHKGGLAAAYLDPANKLGIFNSEIGYPLLNLINMQHEMV